MRQKAANLDLRTALRISLLGLAWIFITYVRNIILNKEITLKLKAIKHLNTLRY